MSKTGRLTTQLCFNVLKIFHCLDKKASWTYEKRIKCQHENTNKQKILVVGKTKRVKSSNVWMPSHLQTMLDKETKDCVLSSQTSAQRLQNR